MLPIAVTTMSTTCSRPRSSGTPCASANGAEITDPIRSTHPSTATGGIIRVDRLMHSAEAAHIPAATRPPTIAITARGYAGTRRRAWCRATRVRFPQAFEHHTRSERVASK